MQIDRRKNSIGFNTAANDVQDSLKAESFIRYDMIRELAGRIGKFVGLEKLEEKDYYQILEEKITIL